MSCALSEPGGAGLGTLGFTLPVARRMLADAAFTSVRVLLMDDKGDEQNADNTRWVEVMA